VTTRQKAERRIEIVATRDDAIARCGASAHAPSCWPTSVTQ
jgi:CDGSH-type Zn-finger protein